MLVSTTLVEDNSDNGPLCISGVSSAAGVDAKVAIDDETHNNRTEAACAHDSAAHNDADQSEAEGVYHHEDCPQGIWRSVRTCTAPSVCHATQCVVFVGLTSLIVAVSVTALRHA